jgi:putative ABC transport system permease protein
MIDRLLLRASVRYWMRHRAQTLLAVLGIAVGVAAWVSVHSASRGVQHAFDVSVVQAFGDASHQLLPLELGLPESWYVELRRTLGVREAAPVLSARVRLDPSMGRALGGAQAESALELLGVDPLAELTMRREGTAIGGANADWLNLLGPGNPVAVSSSLAGRLGLQGGDELRLQRPQGLVSLRVAAVVEEARWPVSHDALLTDLAVAQSVLGRPGELTRVDLRLDPRLEQRVAAWLPPAAELVTTEAHSAAVADMTRAYRLNLQALGLLTLLVGTLLVYSTVTHLVVQRRWLFGRFLALGLPGAALRRLVLLEAALLGLAGGILGTALGAVLAERLLALMAASIADIYFRFEVQTLPLDAFVLAAGPMLGLTAALAGALAPAREAARGSGSAIAQQQR